MNKSMPFNTPILFLVFNRLDTTKEVFNQIKKMKPSKLYVAADGARVDKLGEDKVVNEVKQYILDGIDWDCEVQTLFRELNLGCKNAVYQALKWFFNHEEMGIILEDDCLPNEEFFYFCEELLVKYKDDMRIWHIGGYNQFTPLTEVRDSYVFSHQMSCWGWATWRSRVANYEVQVPELDKEYIMSNMVPNYHSLLFNHMLKDFVHFSEVNNTWDYQWYLNIIVNNGLCIIPKYSLIKNLGLDSGVHYLGKDKLSNPDYYIDNNLKLEFPLKHPIIINSNSKIEMKFIERYYNYKKIKMFLLSFAFGEQVYSLLAYFKNMYKLNFKK